MPGHWFHQHRRKLAMLCVALVVALSAQMTIASLDRLQHELGINHAINPIAGAVVDVDFDNHSHQADHHSHDHAVSDAGTDVADNTADNTNSPVRHHHVCEGALAPMIAPAFFCMERSPRSEPKFRRFSETLSSAFALRQDRPPKIALDSFA